jgi:ABC-type glycerol-3-phosphate transport system permease component
MERWPPRLLPVGDRLIANSMPPQSKEKVSWSRVTRQAKRASLYLVLVLGGSITCFPFVWMILTSFKTYAEAIATPPTMMPKEWSNIAIVFGKFATAFPFVLILFSLWLGLGFVVSHRIRHRFLPWVYIVIHLALFFLLGSLTLLGSRRISALWQTSALHSGIELKSLFSNYVEAWGRAPFGAYFRNSIIISIVTPLLTVATSAPAAYAFARLRFPAKGLLFFLYLATMMVPSEVLLIPNFITITQLGWKNTYAALIIPSTVSVVTIFFLRQFFLSIPNDLFDAATMDGCGHVRFLWTIAMPLSRPALVSTAMFNFLGSWNALLWPLLVTDKENMRPIALGLASFSTEAGMQAQLYMAAATFTIVPVILIFLLVQKQFIEGIARTGIK